MMSNSSLTEARKNELCYRLVKAKLKRMGLENLKREFGNVASELGDDVKTEELMDLAYEMLPEIIGEAFGSKRVSIKMSS